MSQLLHRLHAALIAYGPLGVLLLSVIDSMGVPLPAMDFLLIGVAAGSVRNPRHAYFTALLAVLGSTAGNIVLFQAARHGRRIFGKGEPAEGEKRKFRKWFDRYGLVSVFVPAVTPVAPLPLKVFVVSAGVMRSSFPRFLAVILLARCIRYFGVTYLGIQLGADAQGFLIRNGWNIAGAAIAAAFAMYLVIRLNDRRRQSAL